ncbi:MAG: nuclear transport factor 2 family protein [Planctomycetes bacterium]|nr:nuclear transport factor 2 family protein [Planctomycetota bacterium]
MTLAREDRPKLAAAAAAVLALLAWWLIETDSGRVNKVIERGRVAVLAGDAGAALALFTPDCTWQGRDRAALAEWVKGSLATWRFLDARILKREVAFAADSAEVRLDVFLRAADTAPLPGPMRLDIRFHLVRTDGAWLIDRLEPVREGN